LLLWHAPLVAKRRDRLVDAVDSAHDALADA
jgi:hypothetical protein